MTGEAASASEKAAAKFPTELKKLIRVFVLSAAGLGTVSSLDKGRPLYHFS